ncbi:MAG: hypothetical protein JWQ38_1410 [Flavipsychrobacter sp.]|nr:hypothetical protein [Flavipsychrobacter sp.]
MLKRLLLLGITSGILAGATALIFQKIYSSSLGVDFSNIAKPGAILITNVVGCVVAAIGYWILDKWLKNRTEAVFNFIFAILTFASILPAFSTKLPLDINSPELFPGLVIPMHFFPVLAYFTLEPLFIKLRHTNPHRTN